MGQERKIRNKKNQESPVLSFFTEGAVSILVEGVLWQGLEWDEL